MLLRTSLVNFARTLAEALAVLLVTALPAPPALAQDAVRGQSLYAQLGCNTSNCHAASPAQNLNSVLNGAGSAGAIEYAALFRSEMNSLLTSLQRDESIAIDLAAYLATITPAPPATAPPAPASPPPISAAMFVMK